MCEHKTKSIIKIFRAKSNLRPEVACPPSRRRTFFFPWLSHQLKWAWIQMAVSKVRTDNAKTKAESVGRDQNSHTAMFKYEMRSQWGRYVLLCMSFFLHLGHWVLEALNTVFCLHLQRRRCWSQEGCPHQHCPPEPAAVHGRRW